MQFFRNVDFFGAPFTQQIDEKQSIYRSVLGGIVTLTILSASLAYSVWVIIQWQTNQLSPKISNSLNVSDFKLLDLNYEVIKLYFWKIDETRIDPFESKILLPLVMYTTNYSFTDPEIIHFSKEESHDSYTYYAPKMSLAFVNESGIMKTTSEMYIQIVRCQEIYLKENEKCASQELVDQFFAQPLNTAVIQLHYKQLNSKDSTIQSSIQEFYIQIEPQNCYTISTFLQSNLYQVEKSFLFGEPNYYEFINGALIQTQTNSVEFCSAAYSAEVVSLIYVVMKGSQTKTIFDYPKAGDLLANIGSIVSVLFMMKYVIIFLNEYFVNEKILQDLITIYYPEYKDLIIKKNWRRQIVEVKIQNKPVDLNEYKQFFTSVKNQMQIKLSYMNQLYEISRLYVLIRAEKSREEIRKSHQVGIKLDFVESDTVSKSYASSRPQINSVKLNEDDITLISLSEKLRLPIIHSIIPDELESFENEFYKLNRII